jgi:hypothetical protein
MVTDLLAILKTIREKIVMRIIVDLLRTGIEMKAVRSKAVTAE